MTKLILLLIIAGTVAAYSVAGKEESKLTPCRPGVYYAGR